MRDKQVNYMNAIASQHWHADNELETYQRQQMLKLSKKMSSCGRRITLVSGRVVSIYCRAAICPICSREYANKKALKFIEQFPGLEKNECKFMTVVIGITTDIDQVYPIFDKFRVKFRKDRDNRCNRKDPTSRLWRQFGLSGNCEIDSFMSGDFESLGSIKRNQYEMLGYRPSSGRSEPVYVVTGHFIVYLGRLSMQKVKEIVMKSTPIVHFENLYESQDVSTAVYKTIGYSTKVDYTTTLDNETMKLWNFDQIQALSCLISRSRGRCGLGFAIKPKKRV